MELKFRNLRADEIDVRIGSVNKGGAALLLYKDARADMNILDETVGPLNWQRKHEIIDGKLFCTISVFDPDKNEWVSKQDVGTESYTEKEKGQSSDSFKRACVNMGIGRALYSAPNIFFFTNQLDKYTIENGKAKCYDTFSVVDIQYDDHNNIANVTIRNNSNGITLTFGNPIPEVKPATTASNAVAPPVASTPAAPNKSAAHNINTTSTGNAQKRVPIEGSANESLADKDLSKKIGKEEKEHLIAECNAAYIDINQLLASCRLNSLDQLTHRHYNYIIKYWDKYVAKLSNYF